MFWISVDFNEKSVLPLLSHLHCAYDISLDTNYFGNQNSSTHSYPTSTWYDTLERTYYTLCGYKTAGVIVNLKFLTLKILNSQNSQLSIFLGLKILNSQNS